MPVELRIDCALMRWRAFFFDRAREIKLLSLRDTEAPKQSAIFVDVSTADLAVLIVEMAFDVLVATPVHARDGVDRKPIGVVNPDQAA